MHTFNVHEDLCLHYEMHVPWVSVSHPRMGSSKPYTKMG